MIASAPFLRIEKELPSQLDLVSADRRWLVLFLTAMLALPLSFLGFLIFMAGGDLLFTVPLLLIGLFPIVPLLLFIPTKFQLVIAPGARTITLNRHYWLGFGSLERNREKTWSFNDITDVDLTSQGWKKLVVLESNGKKVLLLDFGRRTEDAQRSYILLQSWLKGLVPDSNAATTALQGLASEKQKRQALKNAEKLLYYFGIFSLIDGAMSLYTDNILTSSVSVATMIKVLTGMIYLVCGFGAKRKIEAALWVGMLVTLAERLYWFIMAESLSGGGSWTSWLTWVFAIFVVSILWQAIQSIRAMEEDPVYKPLA